MLIGQRLREIANRNSLVATHLQPCYKSGMAAKTRGRWVVYERREGKFVFLSKLFATRKQAERERLKLKARPEYKRVNAILLAPLLAYFCWRRAGVPLAARE